MKKKVLVYSIAYYPHVGGAEVAIKEITDRMSDVEWTMVTCLLGRSQLAYELVGNIHVHRVRCPKILFPFFGFWKGVTLHKKEQFDVVWSMMTFAGFPGLFMKLYDRKIKFLLTLQEGIPFSAIKRKSFIVYPLFRMMFQKADMIQAISHFLAQVAKSMDTHSPIIVVPNGVDLSIFTRPPQPHEVHDLAQQFGKKEGDVYLVTTSRLTHKNANDDVINALRYLPPYVYFLIIGSGEQEHYLRNVARDCGVRDRVFFIGFVKQKDIPLFLHIGDIFVRPSRSEGFGNSFIEAMAAGLPVITTPVGGIPDFIDDGETGVFASPDNPQMLSEMILKVMQNKTLREKISRQGKERVIARYSWDVLIHDMYDKVFAPLFESHYM
jgi:glycosyltransferase involved in cell wall biosynthesis